MENFREIVAQSGEHYRYARGDEIGRGAFAKVFRAARVSTGERFALKSIAKRKLAESAEYFHSALAREAAIQKIATESRLPFFVALFDVAEDAKRFYLIVELCDGTLRRSLKSGLRESECLHVALQVGVGLAYLHARGIAHRDVKIENIFCKKGVAKIGDFGLSTDCERMRTNVGTPFYISPEIFEAQSEYSVKVDVWALNTCLHFMLFGRFHFSGFDRRAEPPFSLANELTERVSAETRALLALGYAKRAADRPTMLAYIRHAAFDAIRTPYENAIAQIAAFDAQRFEAIERAVRAFRESLEVYARVALHFRENRIFAFLLLKKRLQNLCLALFAFAESPNSAFLAAIDCAAADWNAFGAQPNAHAIASALRGDVIAAANEYSAFYRSLVLLSAKRGVRIPPFDLSLRIGAAFNERFRRIVALNEKFGEIPFDLTI